MPTIDTASVQAPSRTRVSFRQLLRFIGPGFLISVAYMDPGNWATNIEGGARYGPALLWVIVLASLMAILIQIVAAKLGIATGKGVATICRERLNKPAVFVLWAAAELAMIATDVAEIIGAAIGFSLVFRLPLWTGAVLAAVASFALIGIKEAFERGFRVAEFIVMGLVSVIGLAFVFEMVLAKPSAAMIGSGLIPGMPDSDALFIAIGILGATVMPHSVYLHSTLVQDRRHLMMREEGDTEAVHHRHFLLEAWDTGGALFIAMFVNAAMLLVAAASLMGTGISTLDEAYVTLNTIFGGYSALAFGVALIAAGLSSSFVATMAGQTVMDGFLDLRINVWWRRSVTLIPSLIIVMIGFEPTGVLVASQVALSFELPFVLIPLLLFTMNPALMGALVNTRATSWGLGAIVAVISALNGWLIYSALTGA